VPSAHHRRKAEVCKAKGEEPGHIRAHIKQLQKHVYTTRGGLRFTKTKVRSQATLEHHGRIKSLHLHTHRQGAMVAAVEARGIGYMRAKEHQ
jgi:hypothetical protein